MLIHTFIHSFMNRPPATGPERVEEVYLSWKSISMNSDVGLVLSIRMNCRCVNHIMYQLLFSV